MSTDDKESLDKLSSMISNTAGFHNSIFRGKNITSKLDDGSLWEAISSGTFEDLFVGDYFTKTIDGKLITCRIAGFNLFKNISSTSAYTNTTPHIVIVPDNSLTTAPINTTAKYTIGYTDTELKKVSIPDIASSLIRAFGNSHLMPSRNYTISRVTYSTEYYTSTIGGSNSGGIAELMSEVEVFGYRSLGMYGNTSIVGQFPLFRLDPSFIISTDSVNYWLRDPHYLKLWLCVDHIYTQTNTAPMTDNLGVRPYWSLK